MAASKKSEKATKIKKKHWYPILAPKIFNNAVLGETLITEPGLALNKSITQNLMNLTNDFKKQNINIKFIVNQVEGNKAYTKIVGYNMVPSSIKRLTRRNSEKIDLSLVCKTADNKMIRIKPVIFARNSTKGSVTSKLNKTATECIAREVSKMTFDNLLNDMIIHKFQSSLKMRLKSIYPLRTCEIRSMEIEKDKNPEEDEKAEEKKEVKSEEEKTEKKEVKVEEKPKKEKTKKEEVKVEEKPKEEKEPEKEAEEKPKEEKQEEAEKKQSEEKDNS
ncbi:hypothetical protein ISS05_02175 [Candidatus Woesearchaeota archaeon]|nr:hypothetical protein [Candidatus Woesearchaeota archaeon]